MESLKAVVLTAALTPTKYMVKYCSSSRSTIHINSSLILKLTDDPVEDRTSVGFLHCATSLKTDRHSSIYLHFIELDIAHQSSTPDRLHIYDFNDDGKKVQLTPSKGIYGVFQKPYYTTNTVDSPIRDYQSSGNKFRLDFLGKPTYMYKGFAILLTKVKDARYNGCKKGYFHCKHQDICIPGELQCDGQDNCGALDGSDEFNCAGLEETVTNLLSSYSVYHAVIAAAVGILVFLASFMLIAYCIRKYNRRKYPFVKARALLQRGMCTVTTNLDEERLYAPPSYEDVVANSNGGMPGSSRGNEPPPDYSEYIRTTLNKRRDLTDSEDEDSEYGSPQRENKLNDGMRSRFVNLHDEFQDINPQMNTKGKGGKPKRSSNKTNSTRKFETHDHPSTADDHRDQASSTSASDNVRTGTPSSHGSTISLGFPQTGDDSENDLKSGDSGIENSSERISKYNNNVKSTAREATPNKDTVKN
ncbi:hypothetical protein LOTGIDRAFT_236519 [Lottia gigantea]|uniref:CUB domain-containing protein n=1 Tax=Lottia gigantea TaxID=225164 RepID=V3ZHK6_LOTGI|nr:hypothetical protein LOTGIDRAFT_236519 [Lottia gigantea]ESO83687.1 hypothetical protein LOTGIDRAFT_236519 [Lottia gigantea]